MQDQFGNQPSFTENTPIAYQGPVFASQSQPPSFIVEPTSLCHIIWEHLSISTRISFDIVPKVHPSNMWIYFILRRELDCAEILDDAIANASIDDLMQVKEKNMEQFLVPMKNCIGFGNRIKGEER